MSANSCAGGGSPSLSINSSHNNISLQVCMYKCKYISWRACLAVIKSKAVLLSYIQSVFFFFS